MLTLLTNSRGSATIETAMGLVTLIFISSALYTGLAFNTRISATMFTASTALRQLHTSDIAAARAYLRDANLPGCSIELHHTTTTTTADMSCVMISSRLPLTWTSTLRVNQ